MSVLSSTRRLAANCLTPQAIAAMTLLALLGMWTAAALAADPLPADAVKDVAGTAADVAAGTAGGAAADAVETTQWSWDGLIKVATVLSVIIVPMFLGSFLAKKFRMPDYGWRFALAIGSLLAAVVTLLQGEIKLGPDLSGGITLVYELQDLSADGADGPADAANAANPYAATKRDDNLAKIIHTLTERVDPSGTKEVSIKKLGEGQIEIIIPKASDKDLEFIQRKISTAGILEFRITASTRFSKHERAIAIAQALEPGQDIARAGDVEIARWVEFEPKEFGDVEQARARGLVTRMSGQTPQALVMTNDGLNVTGEFLKSASASFDETGRPEVDFRFNSQGAFRFKQLTSKHLPNPSGERYNLGILLDGRLFSAPTIESAISDSGRISGGSMNQNEVDLLVGILNAGSLPAAINKVPISKATISPTLGELTVEQGERALAISLVLVAIFMAFYYRFAGWVAVLGLACNMLLIVAVMVLIKAAFTLPGLAGLVLTVGMSVDANVLIYERIREELARGAALRMAIRNGFNRATQTIIDSNVTNLITGIVIYKIAPDNVKGFGVTLVLGIIVSIYSAVFLTRIIFDVAERMHWLKRLPMRQFIGETKIDFLSWGRTAIGASLIIIVAGLLATFQRGRDILDIDFTGGSSVTIVLDKGKELPFNEVNELIQNSELTGATLVRVGNADNRYTITTINDNVDEVESILGEAFKDRLKTYSLDVKEVAPVPGGQASVRGGDVLRTWQPWLAAPMPLSYVSFLQQEETTGAAEAPSSPPAESETPAASPASDDASAPETTPPAEAPAADTPATLPAEAPDAAEKEVESQEAAAGDPLAGGTSATLSFGGGDDESGADPGISHDALELLLKDALQATGHAGAAYRLINPDYQRGSIRTFTDWEVRLALPQAEAEQVVAALRSGLNQQPVFPLSNKIGGRVAGDMATAAIAAIILCLIGIIAYVWFRFHGLMYGIAAVTALIHDVLVTLAFVAFSAYLYGGSEAVSSMLLVKNFQINLTLVAAFLTIIGYSLNDTIVIFDRIREIKGKSPRLTREMINLAVNQTLSRTLITSFTTFTSVVILYIFGGDGIHAFAFALIIGLIAGVYSTIFIANPVLLWLSDRFEASAAKKTAAKSAAGRRPSPPLMEVSGKR